MATTTSSTATATSTASLPIPRRSLNRTQLTTALAAAKTTSYPEHPPSTSRNASSSASTPSQIRHLAWSPLGSLIAAADQRSLRVWNPERSNIRLSTELKAPAPAAPPAPQPGRRPPPSSGGLGNVEKVGWHPEREAELASVGADGAVRFWDVRARGACVGSVDVGGEGFSLAWRSPAAGSDELVVGRKDDTLVALSRRALAPIAQHAQPVRTDGIAFSNSGRELLLTTGDGQVKIVDYPSMTPLHTLSGHTSSCHVVAPCPRGRHVAVGASDALVTIWDTTDWVCKSSLAEVSSGPVRVLSWSWDGVFLVAGGDDAGAGVAVAHAETGDVACTVPVAGHHAAPVVGWHPSRYVLAYGGGDAGGMRVVGLGSAAL